MSSGVQCCKIVFSDIRGCTAHTVDSQHRLVLLVASGRILTSTISALLYTSLYCTTLLYAALYCTTLLYATLYCY